MNGKGFSNNKDNLINERELIVIYFMTPKITNPLQLCALKAGKLNVRGKVP